MRICIFCEHDLIVEHTQGIGNCCFGLLVLYVRAVWSCLLSSIIEHDMIFVQGSRVCFDVCLVS